jgi:leader peptidase (prepilin peptidase) / N-methyltransferase
MIPLPLRLGLVFIVGVGLGSFVNWAIYTFAWNRRQISPWMRPLEDAPPRQSADRWPLFGWLGLRRESHLHGRGFWIRPLLLELGLGVAIAGLYWWEVVRFGLIQDQIGFAAAPPLLPLHFQFVSHVLLLCWILAASVIDIDEKIVPDEITVTGTILGLVLATLAPLSLLPQVIERPGQPMVGAAISNLAGGQAVGANGQPLWLEPVTAVAPHAWPPGWAEPGVWGALAIGLGCWWLWCFALAPRIWRGRRGVTFAIRLIAARVCREFNRPPLRWFLGWGTVAIIVVWFFDRLGWKSAHAAWEGLLTSLLGLAGSGGLVWAVRLIGTAALRREAMGFGDVTLMMMVGTFLGWQACLMIFFLAPFAGLLVGLLQFLLRSDDVIPYVPYLCLGAVAVVVGWAPIWNWAQQLFEAGALVPLVLSVCLVMLGVMLTIWRMIKSALFGWEA